MRARVAGAVRRMTPPSGLLAAVAVFVLLAVAHTWPLATDLGTLSRNDNDDTMLNEWIVAWVAHQLPRDPGHLFDANIFYPARRTLARSEPLIVPALLGAPMRWGGASAVLTYNVLLLLGFVLTALAMYAVVAAWTDDRMAGLLAGALLAFNAHTMTRLPHLQAIHAEWLPLALWALDRLLGGGRTRDALALGASVLLLALTSGYLAVFVVFAIGAALVARAGEWCRRERRPMLARLALVTAVTFAVATAALWPYRQLRVEEGFQRPLDGIASLSASGWSYLATTSQVHYPLWSHHIFGQRTQEVLFPGFTALGLCLVALAVRSTALAAGRRRMFVAIGAIGFVMSLGTATPVYAWAYHLFPPMQGIRAAGRFGYLVLFAVAGLAGIGLATLRRRWPARRARLVSIALLGLVTLEAFHAPLRYARFKGISAIYRLIAQDPDPVAVVDVPVFEGDSIYLNATYMLASTEHWKPLLNGYSGSTPQSFKAIAAFMATFPSGESIARLRRLGVRYVVVHLEAFRERDRAIRVVSELLRHPEIELLAVEGGDRLYRIRGVTPRAAGRD